MEKFLQNKNKDNFFNTCMIDLDSLFIIKLDK